MSVHKGLLSVSLAVLFHAAFSATEWSHFSRKEAGEESSRIPMDIAMQTCMGMLLAMVSVINIAGDFKEIRSNVELSQKSWEHSRNRPSFYVYNHRGRTFSPEYIPPVAQQEAKRALNAGQQQIPEHFLS